MKLPPIGPRASDPKSRTDNIKPSLTYPTETRKHVSMQPVAEMNKVRMDVLRANNGSNLPRADSTVSRSSEPSIAAASLDSKRSANARLVSYSQLS